MTAPTNKSSPVTLSESAIEHFSKIAKDKFVKISIVGGSCAGHKYQWDIYENKDSLYEDDFIFDYPDFKFVIDGMSFMFLIGCKIDFVSDIVGSRIEIFNPNASSSCGCGESVSFK